MDTIQDKIDNITVIKDNIIRNLISLKHDLFLAKGREIREKAKIIGKEYYRPDNNINIIKDSSCVEVKIKCISCNISDLCPNKYNSLSYCPNKTERKNIRKLQRINRLSLSVILKVTHKNKECTVNVNDINKTSCCRCWINKATSAHHIIPRKYGGQDYKNNFIGLCGSCHDYVEIKTEDMIESGSHYDVDLLRFLIMSDGFI